MGREKSFISFFLTGVLENKRYYSINNLLLKFDHKNIKYNETKIFKFVLNP